MANAMHLIYDEASDPVFSIELIHDTYETLGLHHLLWCQVDDPHVRISSA